MRRSDDRSGRRTAADEVFERLHEDIATLRLTPGTKLSEVEIAKRLDVSRQPVREAFIRLHELELLRVRPQKATEVRRISESAVRASRFIRTAVEVEVLREACARPLGALEKAFVKNLAQQRKAVESERIERFEALDYRFHHLLCRAAEREFAYDTIAAGKSQVSRLCLLGLAERGELSDTLEDHRQIYEAVREGREARAVALMRHHLSRVERVLGHVRESHSAYFEEH